jgi:hypothetical protein
MSGDEFLGPNVAIGLGAFAQSGKEQVKRVVPSQKTGPNS